VPIVDTDLKLMLSIKTGSAGDSAAQPDPNASLGKYVSTTEMSATALNNLFDNVSGAENSASDVEYRCIFVKNNHATLTALGTIIWLQNQVAGGTDVAIALDGTAKSDADASAAQAASVATEQDAPSGAGAFSAAATSGAALAIGDLAPDEVKAVWVRRTATNSSAVSNDGVTFQVECDTAA
jgi:hypothetical protein